MRGWLGVRRWVLALALSVAAVSGAAAIERVPYTPASIAAAEASGAPYLIFVHAVWCSTCRAQERVLDALAADPRFATLTVVVVDYDTQVPVMRAYGVTQRSTWIAFRGTTEGNRLTGITDAVQLEAFLLAAVQ